MGNTPFFGWDIPDIGTMLQDIPGKVAVGIQDIEDSIHVNGATLTPSSAYTAYPIGASVAEIVNQAGNGWPMASGSLWTVRQKASIRVSQIFLSGAVTGPPQMWARIGGSAGWSAFQQFVGPGNPVAQASGQVTIAGAAGVRAATVVFPAGRFSAAPRVTVSNSATNRPDLQPSCSVDDISSTQCTIYVQRTDTTAASVSWLATQGVE